MSAIQMDRMRIPVFPIRWYSSSQSGSYNSY
jgi:hypothetical protein